MKKIVLSSVLVDKPNIEEKYIDGEKHNFVFIDNEDNERFYLEIKDADAIVTADKPLDSQVINSLSKCQIIVRQGIGYDTIDYKRARERGIIVCNVPDYSIEEVSEYTVAMILLLARHIDTYNSHTRAGIWDIQSIHSKSKFPAMRRSSTQTLGIVGFGRIARLVAKKAKAFGFNLISYDPYVGQNVGDEYEVKMVDLDYLIENSDFITLNLPLTEETQHIINLEMFRKMKDTAYLINTGRGPLVKEDDLYRALKENIIAGAAIDVTETEPLPKDNKLFELENLIVTPHAAFFTEDSFVELRERAFKEAINVLEGKEPENQVNK